MIERQKLLSFMRTKQRLQSDITSLKEDYLAACKSKPPIYISDHSMVRYLERVKGETLTGVSDWDKVYGYLKRKGRYSKDLREEIFSKAEMRHIVANEIERYDKNGYVYIVKGLTLITVYIKEEKNEPNSNNDVDTTVPDSSTSNRNVDNNNEPQCTDQEYGSENKTTHTECGGSISTAKTTGGNPGRRARNIRSLRRDTYDNKQT